MTLRALKLSGVAALLFAGILGGSQPAAACCNYGYYAPAPVVVQPYVQSCGCCGCGGSAYYPSAYPYGYGEAASAYAYDYGYALPSWLRQVIAAAGAADAVDTERSQRRSLLIRSLSVTPARAR